MHTHTVKRNYSRSMDWEEELERELQLEHEQRELDSSRRHRATESGILDLTPLCLLRISAQLCPEDLTALAQVCRTLRTAASEQELWRLLFVQRWGGGQAAEERQLSNGEQQWKELYRMRDQADVRRVRRDEALRDAYIAAAVAKRAEPLDSLAIEKLLRTAAASPGDVSNRVAAFKRDRGIPPTTVKPDSVLGMGHDKKDSGRAGPLKEGATAVPGMSSASGEGCSGGCRFVELDPNLWICEKCGDVHYCGENCGERRIDADEQVICRLTGRAFGHLFKHDGPVQGGAADTDDDWNEDVGGGRLGRAFLAGYTADRNEMRTRFGVDLGV